MAIDLAEPVDLRALPWWRPCRVGLATGLRSSPTVTAFFEELSGAFVEQGHEIGEFGTELDVLLVHIPVPDGEGGLLDRAIEQRPPLMVRMRKDGQIRGPVKHLVGVFVIDDALSEAKHAEVVQTARVVMARSGTPKALFLTPDAETGAIVEATLCTLEGGHPSDRDDIVRRVRDRLVSAACATEVGEHVEQVPDAIAVPDWKTARSPEVLADAGRRMGTLGLLPAPHRVSDYVSPGLASAYHRYLGIKGFSEGMMFVYDPDLQALVVTASGSWEVDKRSLSREDVVVIDHHVADGRLRVLSVAGSVSKGPSVEAWEVCAVMAAAPKVRVRRDHAGVWRIDPDGEVEVPAVRGGLHAHVGVKAADATVIESIAPDRRAFPYGFGCGTDLMVDVATATIARSSAVHDAADTRGYVRWPMLYHGEMALELWRPDSPDEPLTGLLDLFDPLGRAAIEFREDHIDQPA